MLSKVYCEHFQMEERQQECDKHKFTPTFKYL